MKNNKNIFKRFVKRKSEVTNINKVNSSEEEFNIKTKYRN